MLRVTSIIRIAENLDLSGTKKSDILRAVVVLIHSSFETYYRNVLFEKFLLTKCSITI